MATTAAATAPAPSSGGTQRTATATGKGVRRTAAAQGMRGAETWLALAVVMIVALLIVPLPALMLDALLALSLALSIVVLLVTLSTADPLEFSIFPSLLLLLTLLRLGLNVNSTRLILGEGDAGRVIDAFGDAVIGGNYVVGLVIFLILVIINFMVITKGAGRIAEVAARFTLDAMPGKQMSIDADLSAGLIDENEARARREEIARFADFFGSMDGAAKFVRGDAVAGLIITGINLLGGFAIGMAQAGMSAGDALSTYTRLTVGDGLVTQIPALIVSTSAGIIVTYGSTSSKVGPVMAQQLTRYPSAMWIASGILGGVAILPGFPFMPFFLLSGLTASGAWFARERVKAAQAEADAEVEAMAVAPVEQAPIKDLLHVDPMELEIGYALVPLVDAGQDGDLLQRIGLMRKQVAVEMGIIVPPIRIRDNIQLPATEYEIKMRGVRIARGEIMPKYLLALNTSGAADAMDGIQTKDPSFGMPAVWIPADRRVEAETGGYSVVEPQTVLSTHLMETVKRNAGELLGRQECQELLDALKEHAPTLVDDLVPGKLPLGTVHRVLQRLLREGIPVRDLGSILESLADASDITKDAEQLTEHVRRNLSTVIAQLYDDGDGAVRGFTVGPRLEGTLMALFGPRKGAGAEGAGPDPEQLTNALRSLNGLVQKYNAGGGRYPLIAPAHLRVGIRRLVEPVMPDLAVVSLAELPPQMPIQSLGTWELTNAA
jgi:flagellar biosynthesis protein FlhA